MASYPKVRGACEYCHRRKIRCILPPDSSACHNCVASRITCLFAPRAKSGRPRRMPSDHNPIQRPQLSETESSESSGETPESAAYLPTPQEQWGSNEDTNTQALPLQPQFYFPTSRPQWQDFSASEDFSVPSTAAQDMLMASALPSPAITGTSALVSLYGTGATGVSHESVAGFAASARPRPDSSTWTASSSPSSCASSVATTGTPLDFDQALSLCADLDRRYRAVKDATCLRHAESHLQALDSIVMSSMKLDSSSDNGSSALLLAALHKALEISEELVKRRAHMHQTGQAATEKIMLQHLLLLRRLDIVVAFARICFKRSGQSAGIEKAERIRGTIEADLRNDFAVWS